MAEHWVKRKDDGIRSGDVVRFYDELTPDERTALQSLRDLGPYGYLDSKATILEHVAASARHTAEAKKKMDENPGVIPVEQAVRPTYALAQLGLLTIAVTLLVALFLQVRSPHPTPSTATENPRPEPIGEPKSAAAPQKGRAAADRKSDIKVIANRSQPTFAGVQ